MADEISIQGSIVLQRATVGLQAVDSVARDQAGTKGHSINVSVAANTDGNGTTINVGFNMGFLYVKNLATSLQTSGDDVELSLSSWNAGGQQVFARLRPKEFCLVPLSGLSKSTIYARSGNAVARTIQLLATEQ